jgi:CRISPR-associated exonuclease Cas4
MPDHVTGTLIWYWFVCKREVWLMAHELNPREDFEKLQLGRLVHEEAYKRDDKEITIGNVRLDLIREKEGRVLVGEVKKSSSFVEPEIMQLTFYLRELRNMGVDADGQLMFPTERRKLAVELTPESEQKLDAAIADIEHIMAANVPPPFERTHFCGQCAYFEFCAS